MAADHVPEFGKRRRFAGPDRTVKTTLVTELFKVLTLKEYSTPIVSREMACNLEKAEKKHAKELQELHAKYQKQLTDKNLEIERKETALRVKDAKIHALEAELERVSKGKDFGKRDGKKSVGKKRVESSGGNQESAQKLEDTKKQLEKSLAAQESLKSAHQQEIAHLNAAHNAVQKQHDEKIKALQSQVEKIDQKLKAVASENQLLSDAVTSRDSQIEDLLVDVAHLSNVVDNSVHRVDHNHELKDVRKDLYLTQEQNRADTQEIACLQKDLNSSITLEAHQKEIEEDAEYYDKQINALRNQVIELESTNSDLKFENEQIGIKQAKIDTHNAVFESFKVVVIDHISAALFSTADAARDIKDDVCLDWNDNTSNGVDTLRGKLREHTDQLMGFIGSLQKERDDATNELDSLREQLEHAVGVSAIWEADATELRDELQTANAGKMDLQKKLHQANNQILHLSVDLDYAETKRKSTDKDLLKKIEDFHRLKAHAVALTDDKRELKQVLSDAREHATTEISSLKEQLEAKELEVAVWKQSEKEWEVSQTKWDNQKAELQADIDKKTATISQKDFEIVQKERHVACLQLVEAAAMRLLEKNGCPEALLVELQTTRRENWQLRGFNMDWQAEFKKLQEANNDLTEQLTLEKVETMAVKLGFQSSEPVDRKKINKFAEKVKKLQKLYNLQVEYYNNIATHQKSREQEVGHLQMEVAEKTEQITELQQANLGFAHEINRVKVAAFQAHNSSTTLKLADENRQLSEQLASVKRELAKMAMAMDARIHSAKADKAGKEAVSFGSMTNLVDYVWANAMTLNERYAALEKEAERLEEVIRTMKEKEKAKGAKVFE